MNNQLHQQLFRQLLTVIYFIFIRFFYCLILQLTERKKIYRFRSGQKRNKKKIDKQKEIYQQKENNNKLIRITGQTNLKPEKPNKKSQIFK